MKTMRHIILLAAAAAVLVSCAKDEERIYVSGLEASDLIASPSSVVLSSDNSDEVVLSLAWSKSTLQSSNPDIEIGDITIQTLQASLESDFTGTVTESSEDGISKSYTGSALNTLAKNLGAEADVANTIYFRLSCQLGTNLDPVYSNVVNVSVTPFTIDMSTAYILDTSWEPTGVTVWSANADGDYWGFMGATSWYNFYLQEADGTIWGNDGDDGTPFLISSSDTKWNFWFPGQNGCYYVNFNTNTVKWSSLYIPALTLSGDLSGDMTYSRPDNQWTFVFDAASAGNITFQVSGTGSQYDYDTGTEDSDAVSTPVAFTQNGNALGFGTTASDITVSVPAAGESTLIISLADPTNWTATVVSGAAEPTPVNQLLYIPGVSDGYDDWTFNNYLRLYDEDSKSYAGCADIDSPWGYYYCTEENNWTDVYQLGEGDAYSGTLEYQSWNNIPAPEDGGLYFFDVSLGKLTYALTAVEHVYYSGFNDDWSLTEMTASDTAGVYTATVTATGETPWGFEIVLADDWSIELGGSDGNLVKKTSDNISFGETSGSFLLTVDLIHSTYSIEAQ